MSNNQVKPEDGAQGEPQVRSSALVGRQWKAVVNGKKATNGKRYSATYTGDITEALEDSTIYTFLHDIAEHLEVANAEMELPDSIQVTLIPPPNAHHQARSEAELAG